MSKDRNGIDEQVRGCPEGLAIMWNCTAAQRVKVAGARAAFFRDPNWRRSSRADFRFGWWRLQCVWFKIKFARATISLCAHSRLFSQGGSRRECYTREFRHCSSIDDELEGDFANRDLCMLGPDARANERRVGRDL